MTTFFANNTSAVVTAGGTTTSDTSFTVGSVTGFPTALAPGQTFHIADQALQGEKILVTAISGAGPYTWTVTRGDEGSTAVSHGSPFTVQQVVTGGELTAQEGAVNVRFFGVLGDGKQVTDGVMTASSTTLTSATANFTVADVGKNILVQCATATTMRLAGRIASVQSTTQATLTVNATNAGSGQTMVIDGIRTVTDAVTTNNSAIVTSATAAFSTTLDVGKAVWINAANTVGLNTTIAGYTNATTVTLTAGATRSCTGSLATWGTDNTTAIIAAFTWAAGAYNAALYFPAGMYLAKPSHAGVSAMNIPSNTRVFGDGADTIIRSTGAEDPATLSRELWGINTGSGGSSDPSTNVMNVAIEDIQFQGTQIEEGFQENGSNLLSLNACSHVTVQRCKFYNSRSDGIYLGSGTVASTERHNEHVIIKECFFDGVANQCRNGISVIDGTDVVIRDNYFTSWANELMPGSIDCEPNDYPFIRLRAIEIVNNYFTMTGGNQACISMYLNTPVNNFTVPQRGWLASQNMFYNQLSSTLGVLILCPTFPDDTTPRQDIEILNNIFRANQADNTGLANCLEFEGVRGALVQGNIWDVTQFSLIIGNNYKCLDIDIIDNTFKDVGGQGGKAIEITRCDRLRLRGNIFDHASPVSAGGYITRFINGATLATPPGLVVTPSSSGGTLTAAHGAYGYRVSAFLDDGSETVACAEVTGTIATGTAGSNALSWTAVYGTKGYNIYGRTTSGELLMGTNTGVNTTTFTDTGSVVPSGALPTGTSGNGHSNGVIFADNIIRQGSSNNTNNISGVVAGHVNTANSNYYYNNMVPQNAALAMGPFVNQSAAYTVTTGALAADASLVPPNGTVVLTGSTTSAAGTLTVVNGVIGQIITFQFVIPTLNFTYGLATAMKFAGGAAATHTLTAGKSDIYTFRFDGTNWNELSRSINVG